MKCNKARVRKMYEKMDPRAKQYLKALKESPEQGFLQQALVELTGLGKKLTFEMFDKIHAHYSLVSNSASSVYLGMSSRQVKPESEDFYIIEFLSTIEFWEGFFDESVEVDYVKNAKRMLKFLDEISSKAEQNLKNKFN